MNTKIKTIQKKLFALDNTYFINKSSLQACLQLEYDKIFNADKKMKKSILSLEQSNKYDYIDSELVRWIGCTVLPSLVGEERQYFETWLYDNHYAYVDWNNDTIYTQCGPSIIINDDGDAYDEDSGKFIVERSDYKDDKQLHSLINQWMDKHGYFPGVFQVDRNNNVSLVHLS